MSFEDTASVCVNSISEPFKIGCIDALGFHLAGTLDPEQIIGGCNSLGEFSNECIQKATGELVFQNSPGWKEKSQILCDSLSGSEECYSYVDNLVSEYKRK